ncbi:polysaccharide deacetylase family protein [Brevibacterium sp. BRM-1]|uniref:polysaccharide deacetylase family protein n=1 Tax=Brevibacterium sp. BRM-1 TaxID=2999062 RepID=UPI0022826A46|nr:polysaccharide deacetylase family protein [Brevibacterium sp. BRM-1]WAL40443.1 polysaccharide deacetylase family protein [Brevibacterium sp. BRM-1]
MKTLPRAVRAAALATAAALALTACQGGGSSDAQSSGQAPAGSSSAGASAAPSASGPDATASAGPSGDAAADSAALKPGTNHSAAADGYAYPAKDVHDWLWGRKAKSPTYPKKKLAFLTFDDGPTNSTPRTLKELKKAGVPASFFIIGGDKGLGRPKSAGYLKDEIAQGNSVCIHSYTHSFPLLYPGRTASPKAIVKDYTKTVSAVRDVLGEDYRVGCQRYPGGHGWNGMKPADRAMQKKGAWWIDWNSENGDGTDTASSTGAGRAKQALSTLGSNPRVAVILMHDYKDNDATIESIAPLVKALKKKGYDFGVMS